MLAAGIYGIITGVMIRGSSANISYEVSWWADRTHNSKWLDAVELTPKENGISVPLQLIYRTDI